MNRTLIPDTLFGPVVILWSRPEGPPRVARVLLSRPGVSAEAEASRHYPRDTVSSCPEIDSLANDIQAFLSGRNVTFSLELVDWSSCTVFQRSVLKAEHRIPRGDVSTYRLIARHLGNERGSRAVGNALAHNPCPLIIPCHRAIRSDGGLGGFQGGVDMKRALLEMEGVEFDKKGRVVTPQCFFEP
ncbi:MAG: methylated-DNA--[protein]-cysteine S-methyltransferase [Methanoregulaceae archaeon]|nr:methylated-DNA--[protein]-cysteine S-methyltransferase [Methanoregulaceae archaeon]